MKAKHHLSFFLLAAVAPSAVEAACGLTLTTSNVDITWTFATNRVAIHFTVNKSGPEACDYAVAFTKGGGADYASRRMTTGLKNLSYQLYSDVNLTKVLKDIPDVTEVGNVFQDRFEVGPDQSKNFTYYLHIPSGPATTPTLVGKGLYSDTYALRVYEKLGLPVIGDNFADTADTTITATVDPMLGLSLVNTGGQFDVNSTSRNIDFGILRPAQTRTFDLRIWTNAGYSVSFTSTNNGTMVTKKEGVTVGTVPYTVTVGAQSYTLDAPKVVSAGAGSTALSGVPVPVVVTIGNFNPATTHAGAYSDTVTVQATTTE